jgi:serine/threonine-protein kinase
MATVYLAKDLKHDRKVAVKVLKTELAAVLGADRFLSEIKTTANLQHPHILPLFDSGEADGFLFYVMPYVAGESLRAKLDREKQLSVDEAVEITRSVANALDYAHRQGVIHRDIKPANILLHDGQPMVADFGIALAVRAAGGSRLTETGLSLGTPQYMSPEQASGDREVDGRADLYSLGAVLYEMLTGEPPHSGPTVQAIVAKLLTDKPRPVTELRDTVPLQVAATVHKALAKLPADRFGGAGDFQDALLGRTAPPTTMVDRGIQVGPAGTRLWKSLPWAVAALGLILAAWAMWGRGETGAGSGEVQPRHLDVVLPDSAPLVFVGEATFGAGQTALALSPDGSRLVYVGGSRESPRLFVRDLVGSSGVRALPGTEGAFQPFFSPDGEWVAFFADGQLKRISLDGGQLVPVSSNVPDPLGGSWGSDGSILMSLRDARRLAVVPVGGGSEELIDVDSPVYLTFPQQLPESDEILLVCGMPRSHLCVYSLSTRETRALQLDGPPVPFGEAQAPIWGFDPRFISRGFLIYTAPGGNQIWGVRFDPRGLVTTSDPAPILDGVRRENFYGQSQITISDQGDMVFAPGANMDLGRFVWVDEEGRTEDLGFPERMYGSFSLSPDQRRIAAVAINPASDPELLFLDLETGEPRVWPGSLSVYGYPQWDPTSEWVFTVTATDPTTVMKIGVDRGAVGDTLYHGPVEIWPEAVFRDGRFLMWYPPDRQVQEMKMVAMSEEEITSLDSESPRPAPIVDAPGHQNFGRLSPDGRWMAFASQTGAEGYKTLAYPLFEGSGGSVRQLSERGGSSMRWIGDGSGLVFRAGPRWYRVAMTGDPERPFTAAEEILQGNFLLLPGGDSFAVSNDGRRLLLVQGAPEHTTTHLEVRTDWVAELDRILPKNER